VNDIYYTLFGMRSYFGGDQFPSADRNGQTLPPPSQLVRLALWNEATPMRRSRPPRYDLIPNRGYRQKKSQPSTNTRENVWQLLQQAQMDRRAFTTQNKTKREKSGQQSLRRRLQSPVNTIKFFSVTTIKFSEKLKETFVSLKAWFDYIHNTEYNL